MMLGGGADRGGGRRMSSMIEYVSEGSLGKSRRGVAWSSYTKRGYRLIKHDMTRDDDTPSGEIKTSETPMLSHIS